VAPPVPTTQVKQKKTIRRVIKVSKGSNGTTARQGAGVNKGREGDAFDTGTNQGRRLLRWRCQMSEKPGLCEDRPSGIDEAVQDIARCATQKRNPRWDQPDKRWKVRWSDIGNCGGQKNRCVEFMRKGNELKHDRVC